jgi:hypothetical protein
MQFYNLIRAKNLLMKLVKIKFFTQKDNVLMLSLMKQSHVDLKAYNFWLSYLTILDPVKHFIFTNEAEIEMKD